MPTYPCKGSAGAPVTNQVWMSALADKLTMGINLSAFNQTHGGGEFIPDAGPIAAALFANKFVTFHTSFGALTTAPDGTNTGQHITEDTVASVNHVIESGLIVSNASTFTNCYMAGIYKADTRTRIAFGVLDAGTNGYIVGFDLAGGQIAYTATAFGVPQGDLNILGQSITPLGGGWYLCIVSWNGFGSMSFDVAYNDVFLDNGSGTAAASVSYTGTGAGVWGWKTSTLPVDAWGMGNNQVFFDDFNDPTMANFDLNGTFADGFDWYLQAAIPGFWPAVALPPANLSVSSSVLTILPITPGGGQVNASVSGAGNPADGRVRCAVGRNAFAPPFYHESKYKLPYNLQSASNTHDEISLTFSFTLEYCNNLSQATHISGPTPYTSVDGSRVNFSIGGWAPTLGDNDGGGGVELVYKYNLTVFSLVPTTSTFSTSPSFETAAGASIEQMWGLPQWTSVKSTNNIYQGQNAVVFHIPDSTFYINTLAGVNTTEPPNTGWSVFTYPAFFNQSVNANQPPVYADLTQFHTFGYLILPFNRVTQAAGTILLFFDGVYKTSQSWSPIAGHGDTVVHTVDWQRLFFTMQTGAHTGSGYGPSIDYMKVLQ